MPRAVPPPPNRLLWTPLLAIAAAAAAVEIPFLFLGTPSGHDVEFHLYSWLEVLAQWRHGVIYPRWAGLAHFAYGEPRFIFYPPASWTLGALLAAIFPWRFASPLYIWLTLSGAGVAMFLLARQWLSRRDATFAAVLYAVNPYHLVIVYWRSAFAELLASCLLPLLLLSLVKTEADPRRGTILLGTVLAAAWLVNAPAAVMIHYSLALLLVALAWMKRSPRLLLHGFIAVVLGAALAAFYLLPAIYEQKWVNISEAISPGARPGDNFLFFHTGDADHDAFNQLISWTVVTELALTAVAMWAARRWRQKNREIWTLLAAWAATCAAVMFSISHPLWAVLPKLRFMQFPWRWTLCLGVPFSFFIAEGVKKWATRIALYAACLGVLAFLWHHDQSPWWDTPADLREMADNIYTGAGYEGTDEYTPAGADATALDKDAGRVAVEGGAPAAIHIYRWDAESKFFSAEMSAPGTLILHLFNYPAWRVEVRGRTVSAETMEGTGQMLIPVAAGMNHVRLTFTRTWDRKLGGWISVGALLCVALASRRGVAPNAAVKM